MDISGISIAITIFIFGLIVIYLTQFYANVKKYPPGPVPIPILGNLLQLVLRRDKHPFFVIQETGKKYGKLFTFWIGSKPAIIILDMNSGKELFNKYEFSGRPISSLSVMVNGADHESFILMNYSKDVQILRKLSFEAIRQLSLGSKFASVVIQAVDEFVKLIQTREKLNAFSTQKYVKYMFLRIIAELTFGKKYEFDSKELNFIAQTYELFNNEAMKIMLFDFIPITKYILKSTEKSLSEINKLTDIYKKNFEFLQKQHLIGSCDNMCDSIITARHKMIEEGKHSSDFLTDSNLIGTMNILFAAGSDTSICTFIWILYLMSFYPEIQQKLRNEVKTNIGNREPELLDKNIMHYVNAFISETLRFRNVLPIGLFHTNINQTNISGYTIPKNTTIFLHQHSILNDPNYWSEPEKFIPERFLDSNQAFISTRFPAFIPFSTGKRICVGERMAFDMEFLVLTRLLQITNGYQFVLSDEKSDYDLNPNYSGFFSLPKPYKIYLTIHD